ncbi:hypothetical protein SAMN05421788_106204 [Filimonas lacunae]|uniref:Uncharacterized protein n=1 Tax=Filimonas lacunae TaxID=477680 RepID=A0A173MEX3_9BACT|nr:hypothetical protein [Filimonas lacunae]BAV06144.1 hypothetical protein FLA_2159 [Filimonas lacunae]SIT24874.1 hypothetical protein SAMN05421788_106204 [Filimonas lacunae]
MADQNEKLAGDTVAIKQSPALDEKEQALRIKELELKITGLEKPEYKKISTWTGVVAIAVAVTGIVAQGVLYQIKSANAEKDLIEANEKVESANKQASQLRTEISSLEAAKLVALKELEQINDKLSKLQAGGNESIQLIKADINAAAINLRASTTTNQQNAEAKQSLSGAIKDLFSTEASVRGNAYNVIMKYYDGAPELIPALLDYANKNLDNQNGIYNTLVVLSHIEYNKTTTDFIAIRGFAEKAKNIGPRIADRVQKLLDRLPD